MNGTAAKLRGDIDLIPQTRGRNNYLQLNHVGFCYSFHHILLIPNFVDHGHSDSGPQLAMKEFVLFPHQRSYGKYPNSRIKSS